MLVCSFEGAPGNDAEICECLQINGGDTIATIKGVFPRLVRRRAESGRVETVTLKEGIFSYLRQTTGQVHGGQLHIAAFVKARSLIVVSPLGRVTEVRLESC